MYRAVVAALPFCLLVAPIEAQETDHPSAIEAAASIATCMTGLRTLPGEHGVIVSGSVLSASLSDEYEVFARVDRPFGPLGPSVAHIIPVDVPTRGPEWARERERYLLACASEASIDLLPN